MKTKIQETIANQFRVIWQADDNIRAGFKDFTTRMQAESYIKQLENEK